VTKRQQKQLLSQAIGAAFAFRSTSGVSSSASASQDRSNPELSGDAIVFPEGSLGDLSGAVESNTSTGFYFPDGNGFAIVVDGAEVATFTSNGAVFSGNVSVGDAGTDDVSSEAISNVLGVDITPTSWSNNGAIEFCTYPLPATTNGFFVYLSEDNGAVSKSDKIFYFSLARPSATITYQGQPSLSSTKSDATADWQLLVRLEPGAASSAVGKATLYIRRVNITGTSNSAAKVSVTVISANVGAVAVRPSTSISTPADGFPPLGVTFSTTQTRLSIADPTNTGYNAMTTKTNGKTETGGNAAATAQDKTRFSFPSASPARSNGVTTENTTDEYLPVAKWVTTPSGGDKIYDVSWRDARALVSNGGFTGSTPNAGIRTITTLSQSAYNSLPVASRIATTLYIIT
jgi:hypothetical protein